MRVPTPPSEETDEAGILLVRACAGLSLEKWKQITATMQLHQWIALPLSENPVPSLTSIQKNT